MFPYEMDITVPSKFKALTSGKLTNKVTSGDTTTYTYNTHLAGPPFFVWGKYQQQTIAMGDVKLTFWTPEDGSVDPKPMMNLVKEAYAAFQRLLPPSALEAQSIVAVTRYGGYGPPGCLLLQDPYFDPVGIAKPQTLDFVAHELSHSWVNSLAEPTGDPLAMLAEGLATYLGGKAVEKCRDDDQALTVWKENLQTFQSVAYRAVPATELGEALQHADNQVFRAVAYRKGAYMFRELESIIGEEKIFQALGEILQENRGGTMTHKQVRDRIDNLANKDLTRFWELFLESAAAPDYEIVGPEKGDLREVTIRNNGPISPTPVEVVAYSQAGAELARTRSAMIDGKGRKVRFETREPIARIRIDPDLRVLQQESRNDTWPDSRLLKEDKVAIDKLIDDVLKAFREGDHAGIEGMLTTNRDKLNDDTRARFMAAVKDPPTFDVSRTSPTIMFKTGEDTAAANSTPSPTTRARQNPA